MGCLLRLGCLVILLICGAIAYLTRDQWIDKLPWRSAQTETRRTSDASDPSGPRATPSLPSGSGAGARAASPDGWTPLSQAGAQRTRDALRSLSTPRGPVFVTLSGSDVASYIFLQVAKQMPASTDSFVARVDNDRIRLRARMKTSELGGAAGGMIGALMGERERVEMAGTLHVIGPSQAEFRVSDVRVRDLGLPDALVTRMIRPLVRGPRPAGLDDNGLPISIPSYVGDLRVSNGRITLYKNVQ
ncbi:MAG TPA: hypothetical protein VFO55_11475 [Gemmatimonadaceae bacterium]|nr:hypothetical protein [Gemmatimonadaceae bacterium]